MSGVLQVLFAGRAHCFISCQLLVKDEHRVLVKVFVLSHSDITSAVWMDVKQEINLKAFIFTLPQATEKLTIRVIFVQKVGIDTMV